MKTLKFLTAALTLAAAATAVPVHAGLSLNGVNFNGFTANGLALNGFRANGAMWNGVQFNGIRANGLALNGFRTNGLVLNGVSIGGAKTASGEIVAIALPTVIVEKCELANW